MDVYIVGRERGGEEGGRKEGAESELRIELTRVSLVTTLTPTLGK